MERRGNDADRALTDEGKRDAGRLGALLRAEQMVPGLALVSSAERAQQTFAALAGESGTDIPARHDLGLYSATPVQLRTALQGLASDEPCVMIVGHNPAIAEAALSMASTGDDEALARMRGRFPPCSLAVLTFDTDDWRTMAEGRLVRFVTPEDLAR